MERAFLRKRLILLPTSWTPRVTATLAIHTGGYEAAVIWGFDNSAKMLILENFKLVLLN